MLEIFFERPRELSLLISRRLSVEMSKCLEYSNSRINYPFLIPMSCLVVADVPGESRNVLERFYDDLGSK